MQSTLRVLHARTSNTARRALGSSVLRKTCASTRHGPCHANANNGMFVAVPSFMSASIPVTPLKDLPSSAFITLVAQHDALRTLMDRCEVLAAQLESHPETDPGGLEREVKGLRIAFDAHNQFEEQLLRPMLLKHDAFAIVRLDRTVEDHVSEHQMFRNRLASPVVADLRDVIDSLRAHLSAEERYLLTSPVLRAGPR